MFTLNRLHGGVMAVGLGLVVAGCASPALDSEDVTDEAVDNVGIEPQHLITAEEQQAVPQENLGDTATALSEDAQTGATDPDMLANDSSEANLDSTSEAIRWGGGWGGRGYGWGGRPGWGGGWGGGRWGWGAGRPGWGWGGGRPGWGWGGRPGWGGGWGGRPGWGGGWGGRPGWGGRW